MRSLVFSLLGPISATICTAAFAFTFSISNDVAVLSTQVNYNKETQDQVLSEIREMRKENKSDNKEIRERLEHQSIQIEKLKGEIRR